MNCRELYLDLLKKSLLGMIYEDPPFLAPAIGGYATQVYIKKVREWGRDIPSRAHSMIGLRRMGNLQACMEQIVADQIPGDLIETGVWHAGATIFMRGLLAAYGISDRTVWVADSFQGMPTVDLERYPLDREWQPLVGELVVTLEEVRGNFARYGLLDDQVQFLAGWFKETLPSAPVSQLAILRLDGDLYASTWDVLNALYAKVVPGGFVIIDDYRYLSCRQAVTDFRAQEQIGEPIEEIDGTGVYWRRRR